MSYDLADKTSDLTSAIDQINQLWLKDCSIAFMIQTEGARDKDRFIS